MTIYHLIHQTYCNGSIGDFSLPKTVGHFTDRGMSETARDADIKNRHDLGDADLMTTADDYRIVAIHVIEDPHLAGHIEDCLTAIEGTIRSILGTRGPYGASTLRACLHTVTKHLQTIRTLTRPDGGSH